MQLPKSWTTVTPLTKKIALVLFISLPIVGFFAGMKHQQRLYEVEKKELHVSRLAEKPSPTSYEVPTPTLKPFSLEKVNWKTYTNPQYSFSLKYPVEMTDAHIKAESESGSDLKEYLVIEPGRAPDTENPFVGVIIFVWDRKNMEINDISSFLQWCQRNLDDTPEGELDTTRCRPTDEYQIININGKQAYRGIGVYVPNGRYVYYIIFKENFGGFDPLEHLYPNDAKYRAQLRDEIIKSFRFL